MNNNNKNNKIEYEIAHVFLKLKCPDNESRGRGVSKREALCVCVSACLVSDQMGSLPCLALVCEGEGEGRGGRVKGGCHCI